MAKKELVARVELLRVIRILNGETELMKKLSEPSLPVSGKGSGTKDLQEAYKRVMLKLDSMKLIDETPEEAIDFWEDNLDVFADEVPTPPPPEETQKPVVKKDSVKKSESGTPFEELKVKIESRSDDKLTYFIDKLLLKGGDIDDIFKKTAKQASALGLKFGTTSAGEIKALMKHRESLGWEFKVDGDSIELIGYSKPVK